MRSGRDAAQWDGWVLEVGYWVPVPDWDSPCGDAWNEATAFTSSFLKVSVCPYLVFASLTPPLV